jgi:hypothetical protein
MGASRSHAAAAVVAAFALVLVGCDALLGLGSYENVACAFDCGADAHEAAATAGGDAADEEETGTATDGGAHDGEAGVVVTPDSGWPVPTAHELWAHWPMPNPDAAAGPDAATLPNTMTYDAGDGDGGGPVVVDVVTKLSWSRQAQTATSYDEAWKACVSLGSSWRVPTRIELVSLIDFTQPSGSPTIEPTVFPSVKALPTWTSSAVAGDASPPSYWTVDFTTGLTASGGSASQVMCVSGGTP